jgi:hypothetical protein
MQGKGLLHLDLLQVFTILVAVEVGAGELQTRSGDQLTGGQPY